jgi:hypothetical protein
MPKPPVDPEELFDRRRDAARHGVQDDREPREKRSWRDVDRGRDRSAHTQQGRGAETSREPRDRWQSAQAQEALKGQLDELFRDKTGDGLRDAVMMAADKGSLESAVDAYIAAKGELPADPELLDRALDVKKDATLRAVVDACGRALPNADAVQRKVLLLKLKARARTTFDSRVSKGVTALVTQYGVAD